MNAVVAVLAHAAARTSDEGGTYSLQFVQSREFWTLDRSSSEVFSSRAMFDLWKVEGNVALNNSVVTLKTFETEERPRYFVPRRYGFHQYPVALFVDHKSKQSVRFHRVSREHVLLRINKRTVCQGPGHSVVLHHHTARLDMTGCLVRLVALDAQDLGQRGEPLAARLRAVHFVPASTRPTIVTTYSNKGRVDTVYLWYQFVKKNIHDKFLLSDLDNDACATMSALLSPRAFACLRAEDLEFDATGVDHSVAKNNRDARSSYFKFMKFKILAVILLLKNRYDVLNADTDVLFLNPNAMRVFGETTHDLFVQSDERTTARSCELWNEEKEYSRDWICAGLFYARATAASQVFFKIVEEFIGRYELLDQDAMQAVLTGHSQVVVPLNMANRTEWTSFLMVEGVVVNPALSSGVYEKVAAALDGFQWMRLNRSFMNGPLLAQHFVRFQTADLGDVNAVHGNCGTKEWLRTRRFQDSRILDVVLA